MTDQKGPITWVLGWWSEPGNPSMRFEAGQMSPRIVGKEVTTDREVWMIHLLTQDGWEDRVAIRIVREVLRQYPAIAEDECDWITQILDIFGDFRERLTEAEMVRLAIGVLRWHYAHP